LKDSPWMTSTEAVIRSAEMRSACPSIAPWQKLKSLD
jgi:hypothetical protein